MNDVVIDDKLAGHIASLIRLGRDPKDFPDAKRKRTPYRIKFRGEWLVTNSGKTVWSNIGAAKSALKLDFSRGWQFVTLGRSYPNYSFREAIVEKIPALKDRVLSYEERELIAAAVWEHLLKDVEFVPVSAEDFLDIS